MFVFYLQGFEHLVGILDGLRHTYKVKKDLAGYMKNASIF
jgi:hypothetical protein